MKLKVCLALAVSAILCASIVAGEKLKSGPEVGAGIAAFNVVKCSGAPNDNVSVGDELCYRCKYGQNAQVMVFARKSSKAVAALAQGLDSAIEKADGKNLKAFVNLLGEDRDELESAAKELGEGSKLASVPVVVPVEFENGPADYGISPEAEVTVVIAKKGKVAATHALAAGELNEESAQAILSDVQKVIE
ncbi:MAG: hypothetical protein AB7O62_19940 [Pirellulales bacterium]